MSNLAMIGLIPMAAYAIGCVSGAYYLVRWRTGQDLRLVGSGNAGARNAGRVLGRGGFAAALAMDAGKGAFVTLGSRMITGSETVVAASMVAVVAGHVWPAQLGFKGGKGAATALGVLAAYDVRIAIILLAVGLTLLAVSRRLSVGGFAALALAPVAAAAYGRGVVAVVALAMVAGLVAFAHA